MGTDYPVDVLTKYQTKLLKHFNDIGIVFRRKSGSARYYPTTTGMLLTQHEHEEQSIGSGGVRDHGKRAVIFFGWVFFLIVLDFVRRSGTTRTEGPHVGPHLNACGEPNEIELTAAHG